jgi:hypothetical protein
MYTIDLVLYILPKHYDGALDKESTSYNDIFDAFKLALKFCHFEQKTDVYW